MICRCIAWLLLVSLMTVHAAQERTFDIKDFGARGDGKSLDTGSIQRKSD